MFTIECTRKLLARLNRLPSRDGAPPTTRIGNWCGNLISLHGRQRVLVVNVRSLLPVVVPVLPVHEFVHAVREAAGDVLVRIGVPVGIVERELGEMAEAGLAVTSSRQVLGSMNDFARMAGAYARRTELGELALQLADAPCGPIRMRSPREVAKQLVEAGE